MERFALIVMLSLATGTAAAAQTKASSTPAPGVRTFAKNVIVKADSGYERSIEIVHGGTSAGGPYLGKPSSPEKSKWFVNAAVAASASADFIRRMRRDIDAIEPPQGFGRIQNQLVVVLDSLAASVGAWEPIELFCSTAELRDVLGCLERRVTALGRVAQAEGDYAEIRDRARRAFLTAGVAIDSLRRPRD